MLFVVKVEMDDVVVVFFFMLVDDVRLFGILIKVEEEIVID